MLRKLGFAALAILILQTLSTTARSQGFPICGPHAAQLSGSQQIRARFQQFAQSGLFTPRPADSWNSLQSQPGQHYIPDPPCEDREKRLSYSGFDHCNAHAAYQQVFPQVGCNCYTGQCRPTQWKSVPVTAENPEGVEIEINGGYYPVPPEVLHKFYTSGKKMPEYLLNYDAHVCASDPTPEHPIPVIECAWVKDPT